MNKYSKKYIGNTYKATDGTIFLVIAGGTKKGYVLCTIPKEPRYIFTEIAVSSLKAGTVRNPYTVVTAGVGYVGQGLHTTRKKAYGIWEGMLKRCYNPSVKHLYPTYYNKVIVCDEWHNYQVFAEWYEENYIVGNVLDKDALSGVTKIYSPATCAFITPQLNANLAHHKSTGSTKKIPGVGWSVRDGKYRARLHGKHLGYFDNIRDAELAYIIARDAKLNTIIKGEKDARVRYL